MIRVSRLAALFVMAAGSVMLLSACGGGSKKADVTSTRPAVAGTPSPASSPEATPQPGIITINQPQANETLNVPVTVSGTASVFEGALTVAIESSSGDRTFCSAITTASEGAPGTGTFSVMLAFPPPPIISPQTEVARVHVFSLSPKDGSILGEAIAPVYLSGQLPKIVFYSPLCGQTVKSPITISGLATVFDGSLQVAVRDSAGNVLASAKATASSSAPNAGTFSQQLKFSLKGGAQQGRIEAYSISPQDGSVINLFSVPVGLLP